jgi:hypothetical protein
MGEHVEHCRIVRASATHGRAGERIAGIRHLFRDARVTFIDRT